MTTRIRRVPLLALIAAAAACTQTNAALMDHSIRRVRTCPDGIKLYSSPSTVGSEYTEVALLNSTGLSTWTTESGMMKSMREKASEVGATGVIMGNIDEPGAGAKVAAQIFGTYTQRKGKSVAIYAEADAARVQSVCGATLSAQDNSEPVPRILPAPVSARTPVAPPGSKPRPASADIAPTVAAASGIRAEATIGAPGSESDRAAAVDAFNDGREYVGTHEWAKAEQSFQRAILFDGSVAKYHAAMGSLMITLRRWADAQASYSAAVLLDVDNAEYRRLLKETRARR